MLCASLQYASCMFDLSAIPLSCGETHPVLSLATVLPRDFRVELGKYEGQIARLLRYHGLRTWAQTVRESKRPELAEVLLGKCIGTGLFEKIEQNGKKQTVSTGFPERQISATECFNYKAVTLREKVKRLRETLDWLDRSAGSHANSDTYASLLRQCTHAKSLSDGKRLHAHIIKNGYDCDSFLGNLLVQMYGNCGSLEDARVAFDRIPQRNAFSWTIMIAAYARNGRPKDARNVFDKMPQRNVVSWNAMIAAYAQNGHGKEAIELFGRMGVEGVNPNRITFVSVLDACASLAALAQGKNIHARIVEGGFESDVVVGTALVSMYGKCGNVDDARTVFDKMPQRNVVSWNAMIAAYAQNRHGKEALELFGRMDLEGMTPDKFTFTSVLDACANLAALELGKQIHARMMEGGFQIDMVLGSALVSMYGMCGSLDDARSVFDKMPQRDVISWNTMISSYAQNHNGKEALELFTWMQREGMKPNKITFVSVLDACASLAALAQGRRIHTSILDGRFEPDVVLGTALVDMYGKCGCVSDARRVFDDMSQQDVVSWTAMIGAYAQNGHGKEALELFRRMALNDVKPNKVTLINILFACSHAGLLDDGWCYFISMSRDHGIMPTSEHYGCIIDLIGRAGQLDVAEDLINNMPFEPDVVAWMVLLGACRIYGDLERGARAAEQVFELNPMNATPHILLANIYTATGMQDEIAKLRKVMEDRGIQKHPGHSCIEVQDRVHEFVVDDMSHVLKDEIYAELQRLNRQLEEAGYMPDTKAVLHDLVEEEKANMLCYHSEKLAIAFGLISTPAGAPLTIIKNLRVCCNCHAATKYISKIVGRKIVVRDAKYFHHFEHGVCSCGEFW